MFRIHKYLRRYKHIQMNSLQLFRFSCIYYKPFFPHFYGKENNNIQKIPWKHSFEKKMVNDLSILLRFIFFLFVWKWWKRKKICTTREIVHSNMNDFVLVGWMHVIPSTVIIMGFFFHHFERAMCMHVGDWCLPRIGMHFYVM